jgi:GAF domain-containing protein
VSEPPQDLQAALSQLALAVFRSDSLKADLEALLHWTVRLVPTCSSGSVALLVDGEPDTIAVSDRIAFELDMVQYEGGDGPCLSALGGQVVRFGVLRGAERFPHFAVGAADRRVRSVLSTPICHEHAVVGTLNLYSRDVDAFPGMAEHVAGVVAAEAAHAIAKSAVYDEARRLRRALQCEHDEAALVERASSALGALHACSAEQARILLERAVDTTGDTLTAVATRILSTVEQHGTASSA